jgi:hypothetical protein
MCKNSKGNYVDINHFIPLCRYIGVHLSLTSKVGVEESIVNAPRITDQLLKSNLIFVLFVFFLCRLTSGAFTIYFSTPTLRINLNELCH